MALNTDDMGDGRRERLRAILSQIEAVPAGPLREGLLERARDLIADIRRARAAHDAGCRAMRAGRPQDGSSSAP